MGEKASVSEGFSLFELTIQIEKQAKINSIAKVSLEKIVISFCSQER